MSDPARSGSGRVWRHTLPGPVSFSRKAVSTEDHVLDARHVVELEGDGRLEPTCPGWIFIASPGRGSYVTISPSRAIQALPSTRRAAGWRWSAP